jgi:DNA-binding response OmpR family regulator
VATVLIVADDLMWSERLATQARAAGAEARTVAARAALAGALAARPDLVVVDLSARSFAGVDVVAEAAAAGTTVIAVAQHDDRDLRRRALDAGARRAYAYSRMHADGPALIGRWLPAGAALAVPTRP